MSDSDHRAERRGVRGAVLVGVILIVAYLLGYYVRKILGLSRAEIIGEGVYDGTTLDRFQSLYMVAYAIGQLVNGVIGDFLAPRKMIFCGFVLAGISIVVFPFSGWFLLSLACFLLFGFGLSMLRGPMMKIIAENSPPDVARWICVFFSFACYLAVFIATVFVDLLHWRGAFTVSGVILIAVAVGVYLFLLLSEKRGTLSSVYSINEEKKRLSFSEIQKIFTLPGFLFYLMIGGLVETFSSTIIYWMPSFIAGYFEQSAETANLLTSVLSFVTAFCSFLALGLFRLAGGRTKVLHVSLFSVSTALFVTVYLIRDLWLDTACLLLALILLGCVSSLMWSIYIPSLGKSGKVSGANGILDCFGYLFAAGANTLFSFIERSTGWSGLLLSWCAFSLLGVLLSLSKRTARDD